MRRKWKWKTIQIQNLEYKRRYLLLVLFLSGMFFLSLHLILPTLGKYTSSSDLSLDVDYALYLLKEEMSSFDINLEGIVPSTNPYVTTFLIANYEKDKQSDVDLEYTIALRTTTNLPLQYKLYRKKAGEKDFSNNLLPAALDRTDENGSWYHHFALPEKNRLNYSTKAQDYYRLEILFPNSYANHLEYADQIEHIEVTIDSRQVIEEASV